jgi:hypothetical protein
LFFSVAVNQNFFPKFAQRIRLISLILDLGIDFMAAIGGPQERIFIQDDGWKIHFNAL